MKSTNKPQKSEGPGRTGHNADFNQKDSVNFMAACSAVARRFRAVLHWLAMYASPGITAYGVGQVLPACAVRHMEPVPLMPMHKVSGAEIAGAVAACLIRDVQNNGLRINGLPQISVNRAGCDATEYEITLNFDSARVAFEVPALEAIRAAQRFKKGWPQAGAFFDLVQEALWKLGAMPCK